MKKSIKYLASAALALMCASVFSSCEDYLDKDPDSDISEDTPFKNFINFQGYIEEIYNCIPNKAQLNWTSSFNFGDDEIMNPQADHLFTHQVDLGNFWAWQSDYSRSYIGGKPSASTTSTSPFDHRLYDQAWYCISKCNLGIQNLEGIHTVDQDGNPIDVEASNYFVGTKEEYNMLLGQLYFFRGWYHFEMMMWFGGLPYIDYVLPTGETPLLKRLSYQECADKAAADLRKAADLLPIDWDKTAIGKNTLGNNHLRINKITALAYLGKNYLWAASPLMKNGAQTGAGKNGKTYDYDTDYAQKAADTLGELLALVEAGSTQYKLAGFNYSDIYNHEKASGASDCYSDLFFTTGQSWVQPGASEAIFRGPSYGWSFTRYNYSRLFGPNYLENQDNEIHQPTANYVAYAYGMANGLPITDPESGYDNKYPFRDRDPRFYHDIVFDGFTYFNGAPSQESDAEWKYSRLYTGGNAREVSNASRTGYFTQKLVPHTCNKIDGADDYGPNPHAYIPYLRLADVYLMYAEACAVLGGPNGKSSKVGLTSIDALNVLRDRCGAGHVATKYTGNAYMDEVRRERACELAFEGHRFNDLQRWLLLTEDGYTKKTSAEFLRSVADESWFAENDPAEAEIVNYHEETILVREFDSKHYWLPLYRDDCYINPDFKQNPGW